MENLELVKLLIQVGDMVKVMSMSVTSGMITTVNRKDSLRFKLMKLPADDKILNLLPFLVRESLDFS